jgi:rare lipoprotein A
MPSQNFSKIIFALCLWGAGALGFVRAWADPVVSGGSSPTARVDADAAGLGTGLRLPPDPAKDNAQAPDTVAAPGVPDASLATVKRDTADKPHLGQKLGAGIATWYGPHFQGRRTASGERFDRFALTAAHRTLPLGTRVVVSNPRNGRQVVVRINDRGPYTRNRILDLSEAAASALGLKNRGRDWVVMNMILPPSGMPDTAAYAAPGDAGDSLSVHVSKASIVTSPASEAQSANPALKPVPVMTADSAAQLAIEE